MSSGGTYSIQWDWRGQGRVPCGNGAMHVAAVQMVVVADIVVAHMAPSGGSDGKTCVRSNACNFSHMCALCTVKVSLESL